MKIKDCWTYSNHGNPNLGTSIFMATKGSYPLARPARPPTAQPQHSKEVSCCWTWALRWFEKSGENNMWNPSLQNIFGKYWKRCYIYICLEMLFPTPNEISIGNLAWSFLGRSSWIGFPVQFSDTNPHGHAAGAINSVICCNSPCLKAVDPRWLLLAWIISVMINPPGVQLPMENKELMLLNTTQPLE